MRFLLRQIYGRSQHCLWRATPDSVQEYMQFKVGEQNSVLTVYQCVPSDEVQCNLIMVVKILDKTKNLRSWNTTTSKKTLAHFLALFCLF